MKRPVWQKFKMTLNSKFQRHASKVPRSIAEREDPQAVTVTAAARSAATQRGLRGPVCRHRGSQHAARSADCAEELRGASAKRWRSAAECMHGAKERSQREALAECWRSQREALAEPAGSRWLRKGISAERCAHCALHSSTWCSSDLKDGCPLETCSSQDRDSLRRIGQRLAHQVQHGPCAVVWPAQARRRRALAVSRAPLGPPPGAEPCLQLGQV